jgi:hypothetical protein
VHKGFWWENLKERDHLEELGVNGRIKLKFLFKKWNGCMDWIDLIQDRERYRVCVNSVMKPRVP